MARAPRSAAAETPPAGAGEDGSNVGTPESSARVWRGSRIVLRAMEPADWETYWAWDADDDQTRNLEMIPFPKSRAAARQWAERESLRPPDGDNVRFVIADTNDAVVGDLTVHTCNPRTGTFSYGITIRAEERGKGYAAEAIRLALAYYFRELRYQKVTVGVFSFNDASLHLHEKLGFRREGVLRRMTYSGGEFFDQIMFGLTAEEFAATWPPADG